MLSRCLLGVGGKSREVDPSGREDNACRGNSLR